MPGTKTLSKEYKSLMEIPASIKIFSTHRLDIPFIFLLVTVKNVDSFLHHTLCTVYWDFLTFKFFSESICNSFCPKLFLTQCVCSKESDIRCCLQICRFLIQCSINLHGVSSPSGLLNLIYI